MDTGKCRALLCAIEEGTMAQAAEKLGYTPSGVSRMIAALENETGFPLLYRGREGVVPTAECEALLPSLRELLFHEDRYRQTASAICGLNQGTIIVGIAHYDVYFKPLTKLMVEFHKLYPNIKFQVVENISSELAAALREHRIDLCIISKRSELPRWVPLVQDELVVMLSPQHHLAKLAAIPLICLKDENYIDIHANKESDNSLCLEHNHIRLNNRFASVNDDSSALTMVESGMGIAILNNVIAQKMQGNVVFKSLAPAQYVEIGIATHSLEELSPVVHKFVALLEEKLLKQKFTKK